MYSYLIDRLNISAVYSVCFPGGMVDEGVDNTIIQTSLREFEEELGIKPEKVEVLGILRCDWGEVASMTGTRLKCLDQTLKHRMYVSRCNASTTNMLG